MTISKRTIVTILGIAASAALITTMLVGMTSVFALFGRIAVHMSGDWHGEFKDLTKGQIEELKADERIKSVAVMNVENKTTGIRMHTDVKDALRLGNILTMDADAVEHKVTGDYEGRLPQNENEIAVEDAFLRDNGLPEELGSTIVFDLGNRYYLAPDGNKVYLAGNYYSDEYFEYVSEESCIITAILHHNYATDGFDILRAMGDNYYPAINVVDVCLKNCDHTALRQLRQIAADHNLKLSLTNSEYLISVYAFNLKGGVEKVFFTMGSGALAVIIITSIVLIYNAFGMSLTEKMKYLGMLASVGATKKQKRASIYFEGLLLGMIGIPLGIGLGILAAFFTLASLGDTILNSGMLPVGVRESQHIGLVVPPFILLLIVLICFATIFISAFVPAKRASRVMPIDALRQTDTVRVKAKKLRSFPLIRRIFGYEGELAYKNIKRNGSKGTVITTSIIASVVMFLTITYVANGFERENAFELSIPYQVYASLRASEAETLKRELSENNKVKKCYLTDLIAFVFKPDANNPEYIQPDDSILNPAFLNDGYKSVFDDRTIFVCTIEDSDFKELLKANDLDEGYYFGDTVRGVLLNDYYRGKSRGDVFNSGILGQKLHYDVMENYPPDIEIGGMVAYDKANEIFKLVPKNSVAVFVPESRYFAAYAERIDAAKLIETVAVETDDPSEVYDELLAILEGGDYHNYSCGNMEERTRAYMATFLVIKTIMYGFTILITLIVIANLVNTISTGVILRRKEFAMLRSVGMTEKGFKRMLALETLLYGIRALVIGLPLAALLSFMFTKRANSSLKFELDIMMYAIVSASVFAIIALSMLLGARKMNDDDIIDALKEDMC